MPRSAIRPASSTTIWSASRGETDPANRRSTLLLITARGEEVYEQARQARREVARELFGGLSQEQRETLRELLGTVEQA
ncbi:MarR family winged helix-turn-helix transcriptional regulator [Nonomuraea dietziae]|uniref:DNA-binding MarR family transcriptional regulator n=1 Tax=Nonomuraea dietziae TaxID=65515 RepID=A0A7W5YMX5_9ACTN|nr:hypothetical protein [Nonomuraea dietziae]MBB3726832.1 DNA-binding MarR family transcriptional regulator [Nonomuraea dietziae]